MSKKSQYSYGGKSISDLSHEELLEAVEDIWTHNKNIVTEANAKQRAYEDLLKSPFPIHAMWRSYAELVWFSMWIIFLIYLAIHAIKG